MKAQHRTELEQIITGIQLGMSNKKEFLTSLIEQAEGYAESQGMDLDTLHLANDVHYLATLSIADLQDLGLQVGTHAIILTDYDPDPDEGDGLLSGLIPEADAQRPDADYHCVCGFFSTADGMQMQIAWVLLHHTRDGRTLAKYEDRWIPHFNVESVDGSPVGIQDCDTCSRRKQCPSYLQRISDDLANGFPRSDLTLTRKEQADVSSSTVLRDLAETLGDLEGSFSDARWESFKKSHEKLIELCTAVDGVLTFSDNQEGTDAILLSSDASHNGFCIRQRDRYLELCQYMESIDIEDAFETQDGVLNENAQIFRVVGRTENWRDLLPFVDNYADRLSTDSGIYTVPLSLQVSINQRGPIGRNLGAFRMAIRALQPVLSKTEKKHAAAFVDDLTGAFSKKRYPSMDGGPSATLS